MINTLILFLTLVLITKQQEPIGANIVWATLGGDLVTQSSPTDY